MSLNKSLNLENIKSGRERHLIPCLILLRVSIVDSNSMASFEQPHCLPQSFTQICAKSQQERVHPSHHLVVGSGFNAFDRNCTAGSSLIDSRWEFSGVRRRGWSCYHLHYPPPLIAKASKCFKEEEEIIFAVVSPGESCETVDPSVNRSLHSGGITLFSKPHSTTHLKKTTPRCTTQRGGSHHQQEDKIYGSQRS